MSTKSIILGVAMSMASSFAFATVKPVVKSSKQSKTILNVNVKKSNCFPVKMQSDCLTISGTWCGSLASLMVIIDSFLATECP